MRGSAAFRLSPTPGGVLAPLVRDPDARDYIRRVAAADGQRLEPLVQRAIDAFVRGCKADGIWNAIKASCILAGARTLSGALVPLVGAAPTNNNFVAGDYNRETGLVGDGSTKYLDSNRNNNADPQDNHHLAAWIHTLPTSGATFMAAGVTNIGTSALVNTGTRSRNGLIDPFPTAPVAPTFMGASRTASNQYTQRADNTNTTVTQASQTPYNANVFVYARNDSGPTLYANPRLAFYSIGESLDLALLDARVTDLINAFGAAIP